MTPEEIDNYIQLGLLILTAISLISPIIVTLMNHHYDFKIRKFEYSAKIKQEALSNFANHSMDRYNDNKANFYAALAQLYAYFDIDDTKANQLLYDAYPSINIYHMAVIEFIKSVRDQLSNK